jgi:hypothetical protein
MEVAKSVEEAILEYTPPIQSRIPLALVPREHRDPGGPPRHHQRPHHHLPVARQRAGDQKQAILSNGISEAMNNTAFGLGIAVSCIIAHLFLTAYAKKMVETVELSALKLENLLSRRQAGETSAMDFERSALDRAPPRVSRMAFFYSKRKLRIRRPTRRAELNIVPYLDILMNLIMFMLLSITGLAAFGILNVNAPNYGGPTTRSPTR